MAQEYRLVFLTPGQQPPIGSTGTTLSGGGIMWVGEENTFPNTATIGELLPGDLQPSTTYDSRLATEDEIDEYTNKPSGPTMPPQ